MCQDLLPGLRLLPGGRWGRPGCRWRGFYEDSRATIQGNRPDAATPVEQFTLEQLARALDWEDSIDSWFAAVRERALAELTKDPNSVPFYKLVEGRSLRIWGDEESVKTAFGVLMGERIYAPRKLLSPAQMEKVVSKEDVARFTVKPPGKPTVVKATDKRQAVVRPMEASVVFDVIPSQELCCSQCRGAGETSPGVECPGCDGTGGIASKKECQNCGCPYSSHNGIGSETCGRVGCGCPGGFLNLNKSKK